MRSPLSACAGELPVSFASSAQRRTDGGAKGCVGEQPVLGCEAPAVLAAAGGGITNGCVGEQPWRLAEGMAKGCVGVQASLPRWLAVVRRSDSTKRRLKRSA